MHINIYNILVVFILLWRGGGRERERSRERERERDEHCFRKQTVAAGMAVSK